MELAVTFTTTAELEVKLEKEPELQAEFDGGEEFDVRMQNLKVVNTGNTGIATESSLGVVMVGENLKITEQGVLSVDMAGAIEEDNTRPISSAKVYAEVGNINALLATI